MVLTYVGFKAVPVGFIPEQDKGYLVVNVQLPDGATLDRTDRVVRELGRGGRARTRAWTTPSRCPGYSILLSSNISNVGGMFVLLKPFEERAGRADLGAAAIMARLRQKFAANRGARLAVFGAPPVDGLGSTGGFKLQVQDRRGAGLTALQGAAGRRCGAGQRRPEAARACSPPSAWTSRSCTSTSMRRRPKRSRSPLRTSTRRCRPTSARSTSTTSSSRTATGRSTSRPARPTATRSATSATWRCATPKATGCRLRTLVTVTYVSGPAIVNHYNLYPSAEINGGTAPGVSSGQAIQIMDGVTADYLPSTMGAEWTELTYQQILAEQGPADEAGLSAGGGLRLPGAGGAVRELVAAAGDHPHRARCACWPPSPASG